MNDPDNAATGNYPGKPITISADLITETGTLRIAPSQTDCCQSACRSMAIMSFRWRTWCVDSIKSVTTGNVGMDRHRPPMMLSRQVWNCTPNTFSFPKAVGRVI
ncbi:hypothetical protein [Glaciimonas soli]|uniref:hypothetical protein n=1 Tax=Glaciimonas soli TaxID=2590999 RepID=UPI001D171689|nr:hypothetical protein [Glaciimonas soli]